MNIKQKNRKSYPAKWDRMPDNYRISGIAPQITILHQGNAPDGLLVYNVLQTYIGIPH